MRLVFPFCSWGVVTKLYGLSLVSKCVPLSSPLVSYSGDMLLICVTTHLLWLLCMMPHSFFGGKFLSTVLSLEARGACRDSAVFCNHCVVFWSFFKTSSTRKVKLSLLWVITISHNLLSPNLHTSCAGLQVIQRILLRAEFCVLADVEACSAVWNGNTDLMPFQPWTDIACFCPKLLRNTEVGILQQYP